MSDSLAINRSSVSRYLKNCFLLLVPVVIWNIAFTQLLPPVFRGEALSKDIPSFIIYGETFLMILVFILPLFMPLTIYFKFQKYGLALYFIGLFLYFLSWRPLILFPDGAWSNSLAGFMAPALTPLIFLVGIGLIGDRLFFNIRYSQTVYLVLAVLFVLFQVWQSYAAYQHSI